MDETVLISKLESSDFNGVRSQFSEYLSPFAELTNPKKTKRTAKQKDDHKTLARSLAKKFLPFLNRALASLPKRLSDPSKISGAGEMSALEFFEVYRLCLNCLESVSSELSGKPYAVHFQRLRMVRSLEVWGRWKEAETECFGVLEKLKDVAGSGRSEQSLLPEVKKCDGDSEFGSLVAEIVVSLVKCVSMNQSKEIGDYRRVVQLMEESRCWFRVLDANTYEKMHRVLVAYVGRCAIFLLGEVIFVDEDLTREFLIMAMAEYSKSSIRDQIYKVAGRICSTLFSRQDYTNKFAINMLTCVLDSLYKEGKVEREGNEIDFIELIAYCSSKCQERLYFCNSVSAHLNKITGSQVKTPFHLALKLYATGLLIVNHKLKSMCSDNSFSGDVLWTLCSGDVLPNLGALLCSLSSYIHKWSVKNCMLSGFESKDTGRLLCSPGISPNEDSTEEAQYGGRAYAFIYLNALKYVCLPLAEVVNSEKKQIISERDVTAVSSAKLSLVQEAFYQFYDAFYLVKRCKSISEAQKDGFDETNILGIALASFIVSLGTKLNMEKSVHLLKYVISSAWIQPNGLKHLFTSLYNIAVVLYRDGQLKEALKALKLSFRSSWTYVLHLCEPESNDDLLEDTIVDFVNDSCTRSAFLLNALHECDSHKVKNMITKSLENWSVAANLFSKLPGPTSLVKQWVKIECKSYKNVDALDTAQSLCSFLSPSEKVSKRAIGIILEQELQSYQEVTGRHPELSQKMQMKIIGHLLEDVYISPESWLQRSKILVRKGRVLRFYGLCLKDCIQCLSDAISSLKTIRGETSNYGVQPCHQLAVAHCLRAFCTQEAEPNSKQIFQDINMALKLWLSITNQDHVSADKFFLESENMMILLYNIVDLLSLKGCTEYHCDIYCLMFRLFDWRNFPLEKSLAVLWECRRLSHALCVSPVNDAFLSSLEDHYDGLSGSVDLWISCLKGSEALRVGFEHNFSFLFTNNLQGSLNHESTIRTNITLEEVENAAFQLISGDPASNSVFVAGYLFYDLSERLISNGHTTEALMYAKEAHRLRSKLFEEKFKFSVEQQPEKSNEVADVLRKVTCSLQDLQLRRSVANELWSFDTISWDMEKCYLSPWAVLQCYLESTFQVGVACELIGDGAEAEALFLWGKSISCSQNLPLFIVTFSSVLGKLYSKKQLWDLAEKELHDSRKYLEANRKEISCLKCRLMLEVTVDQNYGDFSQSIVDISNERTSIERSSRAEALYKSALDKLNCLDWKISPSIPEVACPVGLVLDKAQVKGRKFDEDTLENHQDVKKPSRRKPKENQEVNKSRNTRNSAKPNLKEQDAMPANNLRTTRSKNRSAQVKSLSSEPQVANPNHGGENECSASCSQTEIKSSNVSNRAAGIKICNKMRCWHCLQMEVLKNGFLRNFIDMKWEYFRRKLSLRLLTGLGNCFESRGQIHEAHEIFLDGILILVNQDLFHLTTSSVHCTRLLDVIGKEVLEDTLSVERAELLYSICWLSLKGHHCNSTRVACCDMSNVQLPQLVSWLMQAFISCSEVPMFFQKVSRLLAVIFLLAGGGGIYSLSSSCKALSETQWASFFHQASVGTHLNYRFFSNNDRMSEGKHQVDTKVSYFSGPTCLGAEIRKLPSLSPKSVEDLEEFVVNFFASFPSTTAICISILGGSYAYLLQEMLHYPLLIRAWMLVSRLDSQGQPIVLLLPTDSILEEASDDCATSGASCCSKHWQCPWGSTVVDNVAPEFRLILEENYLSSSVFPSDDTPENRKLWWTWRKRLDYRLGEFLRNVEDSWLGPSKYILLGQRSNHKSLEPVLNKLARTLKTTCEIDVNESLLSIILGAPKDALDEEDFILQLCFRKGCYIGRTEWRDKRRCSPSLNEVGGPEKFSGLALKLLRKAVDTLEDEDHIDREPMILVLDFDVQMLPWENIPILRNQEVYRMPSVWSISASLNRSFQNHEQSRTFPVIDPLDAFYLLNPGGDLSSTQTTFENWFRDQNFEGKAGNVPTAEELAEALKSHDLFLYFGHGSGAQYIPGRKIQKLENCAATLLMGCSSGSLTLNGCYAPHGTPLCYLIAGSPVIVANLWEVTDKDIDRFGKAVLDSWFKERLCSSAGCSQCSLVAEELGALSLKGRKGNAKKKVSRKGLVETFEGESSVSVENRCDHRPKIGSFMGRAREACTLPFLIGAAPVCYGVPTGIRNKKDLKQLCLK